MEPNRMSEQKKIPEQVIDQISSPDSPLLADVLAKYEISLSAEKVERLDRYCRALWEWNTKLNLTRHDDYESS